MRKTTLLMCVLGTLLLQACATRFTHDEYPLKADMIPAFDVKGQVAITNVQPATSRYTVTNDDPLPLYSDLHTLTDGVVQQAIEELGRHGQVTGTGKPKSIGLRVLSLQSKNRVFAFHSVMHMEAILGDGETIELSNEHTTGWTVFQDLNGCMAEGVMTLFTNDKVLAYLAQ